MGDFLLWVERASWCWLALIAPILYRRPQKVIRVLSDGSNGYRTTVEIMLRCLAASLRLERLDNPL